MCLDARLELLIAHRLDAAGMLDLHLPRHEKRKDFEVRGRLVLAHLSNCRWTAVPEVSELTPRMMDDKAHVPFPSALRQREPLSIPRRFGEHKDDGASTPNERS